MDLKCCACGKEQQIKHIEGKDKRFYVDIQGKLLLRIKSAFSIYVLCEDCAKKLSIID